MENYMDHMPVPGTADVYIGLQRGDEGKGKLVDLMAIWYDYVVRWNGGANAGHSVKFGDQYLALNQLPSGVAHPNVKLYIASKCAVDLGLLWEEIERVSAAGIDGILNRLQISAQASVVQPAHILRDLMSSKAAVGTTGRGIGPLYAAQRARVGIEKERIDIRLGDLLQNPDWAFAQIRKNYVRECEIWNIPPTDADMWIDRMKMALEKLRGCIDRDPTTLAKALRNKMKLCMEGAQSIWLDPIKGHTPDVTASDTCVPAAFDSGGFSITHRGKVLGVVKLTPTRVGRGPSIGEWGGFQSEEYTLATDPDNQPTNRKAVEIERYGERVNELIGSDDDFEVGVGLRIKGNEYGVVSKRPRRMNRLDLVEMQHGILTQGVDGLLLTKGDVLNHYQFTRDGKIPVVTGYKLDGGDIDYVPTTGDEVRRIQLIEQPYDTFTHDITAIRDESQVPPEVMKLLTDIRDRTGARIMSLGVGPDRSEMVHFRSKL